LQSKDNFRYLELELPPPVNSRIAKSAFVKSSAKVGDCPPSRGFPEFAVIGRSNVGKSSLINSLTGNDKLAKVSKEPGK
jgi:GTP-binding protein